MRSAAAAVRLVLVLLAALAGGRGVVRAVEVWMPETGEVELEQLPRDTVEARRKHALALIGAGQWAGGVAELHELIEADPGAAWVGDARMAIARALLAAGKHRRAFEELEGLRGDAGDEPLAARGRQLQFTVARAAAAEDTGLGLSFYDRLFESAATPEAKVYVQKEKADALFVAGRYLDAEDGYLTIIRTRPENEWVPYCWYKVADCKWHLAKWLDLGLERLKEAEREFSDFISTFPAHANREEAEQKVAEVRHRQAGVYGRVSRFYIEAERKPWAAVNYLAYIRESFADTPEAVWAAEELNRIEAEAEVPLRRSFRTLDLPGVERQQPGRPTDSARTGRASR